MSKGRGKLIVVLMMVLMLMSVGAITLVDLERDVRGVLPFPNGGTGQTSWTASTCVHVNSLGNALESTGADCTSPVANTTTTIGTITVGANTHTSATNVSMPGVTTGMVCDFTFTTDVSGVTGWGDTGGLIIRSWPTADNCNYRVVNQTGSPITTSGSVTLNVSAR